MKKNSLKIGLQLYTLRDFLKTPEDISSTLKKVKEIGYREVQISGIGKIEPSMLKEILNREGLKANSIHYPYQELTNNLIRIVQECQLLNIKIIACPALPEDLRNEKGFKEGAKKLSEIGKILSSYGIILAYHNHAYELEKFEGKTGLEILLEESEENSLKLELDTYWIQYGGGDPAYWCEKFRERLILLHAKDMGIRNNQQIMLPVGEGNLNWERIFQTIQDSLCECIVVEQDTCEGDPFESVKRSLENLKKMGLEV